MDAKYKDIQSEDGLSLINTDILQMDSYAKGMNLSGNSCLTQTYVGSRISERHTLGKTTILIKTIDFALRY